MMIIKSQVSRRGERITENEDLGCDLNSAIKVTSRVLLELSLYRNDINSQEDGLGAL